MTLVDLTHPLTTAANVPAGTPAVEQRRLTCHGRDRLQDTWVGLPVHAGTHLDAPLHAVPGGADVAALELGRLIGPAVAWRFECRSARAIGVDELIAARPRLRGGERVLLATGWDRHYGAHERYGVHPHLTPEAARWLVEQGVALAGFDTPTPDLPAPLRESGFDYPVHRALLGAGVLIVENLANVDRVAGRRFRLLVAAIPIGGSDGAPARVVADFGAG